MNKYSTFGYSDDFNEIEDDDELYDVTDKFFSSGHPDENLVIHVAKNVADVVEEGKIDLLNTDVHEFVDKCNKKCDDDYIIQRIMEILKSNPIEEEVSIEELLERLSSND